MDAGWDGSIFLPSEMAAPLTEPAPQPARSFELPFTDVTLRAGADGATVRVHRGELGFHSRFFLEVLSTTETPLDELPLPGKTGEDLALLTAFMYPRRSRDESFTGKSIGRLCELGREYDMPELLVAADDWLTAHANDLVLPANGAFAPQTAERMAQFFKLMQIAYDFKFSRFVELCIGSWAQCTGKHAVLERYAGDARRLDSEVLFRLLSSVCEQTSPCRHCNNYRGASGYCNYCGRTSSY